MNSLDVPISEFCKTGSGGTPSRAKADRYYGGRIPWVKSGELREGTVTSTEESITDDAIAETAAKLVPAGALLVAMYGATVGRVGRLGMDAATNQAVCHIVPDSTKVDDTYLFHALQAKVPEWLGKRVGGAQPNISQGIIRETKVRLPPLPEQRRIAAILDKADAIRRKRQETIRLTEALLRSAFLEMFGDPNENPRHWDTIPLGRLLAEGPTNGLYKPASCYGRGVPIVRIDSFYNGELVAMESLKRLEASAEEVNKYRVNRGDVLINRVNSREYLGKSAFIRVPVEGLVYESNMMKLTPDAHRLEGQYLVDLLQTRYIKAQIDNCAKDAVNQASINQTDVRSFNIRVPPIELQRRWGAVRGTITRILQQYQEDRGPSELASSLTQRAFSGRL